MQLTFKGLVMSILMTEECDKHIANYILLSIHCCFIVPEDHFVSIIILININKIERKSFAEVFQFYRSSIVTLYNIVLHQSMMLS